MISEVMRILHHYFASAQIVDVLMVKFRETKNLMNVLTQYEILRFCRLGVNRLKFYRTKTWDIMTESQISLNF
jgi:hypothetical protein